MRVYPDSALTQLEFDKVKTLLADLCKTNYGQQKAGELRVHTHRNYIELELQQSHEFKMLLLQQQYFPNDFLLDIRKELKLLG
ncbi:hypothetical protein ABTH46_19770, partial [Acinetobacter baumannii]